MASSIRSKKMLLGILQGFNEHQENLVQMQAAKQKLNQEKRLFDLKIKQQEAGIAFMKQFSGQVDPDEIATQEAKTKSEKAAANAKFNFTQATQDQAISTTSTRLNEAAKIIQPILRQEGISYNPMTGNISFKSEFVTPEEQELEGLKVRKERAQTSLAEKEAGIRPFDRMVAGTMAADTGRTTQAPAQEVQAPSTTAPEIPPEVAAQPELKQKAVAEQTQQVAPEVQQQQAVTSGFVPTQVTSNAASVITSTKYENLEADIQKKTSEKNLAVATRTLEEAAKSVKNFNRSVQLYSGLVATIRAKAREQGGLGLMRGLNGKAQVALKNKKFPATAAYPGQRTESALALNGIITGQNRVIRSVVLMIFGTLPDELDPDTFAAQKIAQSLTNAFKLQKGIADGIFTLEELEELKDELDDNGNVIETAGDKLAVRVHQRMALTANENAALEAIIEEVLNTPEQKRFRIPGIVGETIQEELKFDEEAALAAGFTKEEIADFKKQRNL